MFLKHYDGLRRTKSHLQRILFEVQINLCHICFHKTAWSCDVRKECSELVACLSRWCPMWCSIGHITTWSPLEAGPGCSHSFSITHKLSNLIKRDNKGAASQVCHQKLFEMLCMNGNSDMHLNVYIHTIFNVLYLNESIAPILFSFNKTVGCFAVVAVWCFLKC